MAYPVNATFQHQEKSSRLWALLTLIAVKYIALIPHLVVMMVLQIAANIIGLIGVFAVLFTGKFPKSWANFILNVMRWGWRVASYYMCMTDKYPPFKLSGAEYPADVSFEYQEQSSRLWALLTIIPIKLVLVIPHFIVLMVIEIIAAACMFLGIFGTLFMGRYPASFEKVIVTFFRYMLRLQVYFLCITDKYPPISWKA